MAFYQFNYDAEIFKKLPFIREFLGYVYADSTGTLHKEFMCLVNSMDFGKIKKHLKGDAESSIVSNDKVFILPNCNIPAFKIKEYFKTVGATQTGNIEEATKIIGHNRTEAGDHYANSALVRNISYHFAPDDEQDNHKGWDEVILKFAKETPVKQLGENQPKKIIVDYSLRKKLKRTHSSYNNYYLITPTCGMILYYKLLNKIPVISEEALFGVIQKPLILDKEICESLSAMLSSPDESNQKTAVELISNCDIEASRYYLWLLIREHNGRLHNHMRNKNFRLFRNKIRYYHLVGMGPSEILPDLEERGLLTPDIYEELIDEIFKRYAQVTSTEFFDITLVPSEKYKKYSKGLQYTLKANSSQIEKEEEEKEEEKYQEEGPEYDEENDPEEDQQEEQEEENEY